MGEKTSVEKCIQILQASDHYSSFLDSFISIVKLNVDFEKTHISEAFYYHICKMKLAGWKHKVEFNRDVKHSFSNFFQDIIAFYLKATLPEGFVIHVEKKEKKVQPDIVLEKNGKYKFVVEVKTSIGYGREGLLKIESRVSDISAAFNLPKENIIYIFEIN